MQRSIRIGPFRLARQVALSIPIYRILVLFDAAWQSWRRYRTAEELHALDDRTLADIGLRRDGIDAALRDRLGDR